MSSAFAGDYAAAFAAMGETLGRDVQRRRRTFDAETLTAIVSAVQSEEETGIEGRTLRLTCRATFALADAPDPHESDVWIIDEQEWACEAVEHRSETTARVRLTRRPLAERSRPQARKGS